MCIIEGKEKRYKHDTWEGEGGGERGWAAGDVTTRDLGTLCKRSGHGAAGLGKRVRRTRGLAISSGATARRHAAAAVDS